MSYFLISIYNLNMSIKKMKIYSILSATDQKALKKAKIH